MAHPLVDGKPCRCSPECLAAARLAWRRAYDANRRATNTMPTAHDMRRCWRCDIEFSAHFKYHSDAPCADCREFLKKNDGETTVWRGPSQIPATRLTRSVPV